MQGRYSPEEPLLSPQSHRVRLNAQVVHKRLEEDRRAIIPRAFTICLAEMAIHGSRRRFPRVETTLCPRNINGCAQMICHHLFRRVPEHLQKARNDSLVPGFAKDINDHRFLFSRYLYLSYRDKRRRSLATFFHPCPSPHDKFLFAVVL